MEGWDLGEDEPGIAGSLPLLSIHGFHLLAQELPGCRENNNLV